jgi:hypothetical protein
MSSREVDAIMVYVMRHVALAMVTPVPQQAAYSWCMAEAWMRRAEQVILSGEG